MGRLYNPYNSITRVWTKEVAVDRGYRHELLERLTWQSLITNWFLGEDEREIKDDSLLSGLGDWVDDAAAHRHRSKFKKMISSGKRWIPSAYGRPQGECPAFPRQFIIPTHFSRHLRDSLPAWKAVRQITDISALWARTNFFSLLYPCLGLGTH